MESGGHRWQRISPTERRGRVHTSTVTVAVLPVNEQQIVDFRDSDLEWEATRGSGPGGQHRNKTDSAVRLTHRPTGMTVRVEVQRSQYQNLQLAKILLGARLTQAREGASAMERNSSRRAQIGSGQRGDKIRTVRCQDGVVTDHRTGKRWSYRDYRKGLWG